MKIFFLHHNLLFFCFFTIPLLCGVDQCANHDVKLYSFLCGETIMHQQKTKSISFKKLTEHDIPLLLTWFAEPHVYQWWPVLEKNEPLDNFLKRIRSVNTFGYI